jgi:hypothetical protein
MTTFRWPPLLISLCPPLLYTIGLFHGTRHEKCYRYGKYVDTIQEVTIVYLDLTDQSRPRI